MWSWSGWVLQGGKCVWRFSECFSARKWNVKLVLAWFCRSEVRFLNIRSRARRFSHCPRGTPYPSLSFSPCALEWPPSELGLCPRAAHSRAQEYLFVCQVYEKSEYKSFPWRKKKENFDFSKFQSDLKQFQKKWSFCSWCSENFKEYSRKLFCYSGNFFTELSSFHTLNKSHTTTQAPAIPTPIPSIFNSFFVSRSDFEPSSFVFFCIMAYPVSNRPGNGHACELISLDLVGSYK